MADEHRFRCIALAVRPLASSGLHVDHGGVARYRFMQDDVEVWSIDEWDAKMRTYAGALVGQYPRLRVIDEDSGAVIWDATDLDGPKPKSN